MLLCTACCVHCSPSWAASDCGKLVDPLLLFNSLRLHVAVIWLHGPCSNITAEAAPTNFIQSNLPNNASPVFAAHLMTILYVVKPG